MRKLFFLIMLVVVSGIMSGCSEDGSSSLALPDDQGNEIAFEAMDQPALVFFFTGNQWDYCKSQLVELQNQKDLFSQFPGNVYAVSVSSVKEHKKLKEELELDYPLITDEDLDLIRKVKLVDPKAPKSLRGFAVLDKEGKVLHSQELNPFGEEAEEIFPFAADLANGKQPAN